MSLGGKSIDRPGDFAHERTRGGPAVEPEIEGHLVVARAARVQCGAGGRDLGQPPLDGGVNVLIGIDEGELASVELAPDPAKPAFDGGQLGRGYESGLREAARVGDAPADVERVELEIGVERR
jgi:hypothetical protein